MKLRDYRCPCMVKIKKPAVDGENQGDSARTNSSNGKKRQQCGNTRNIVSLNCMDCSMCNDCFNRAYRKKKSEIIEKLQETKGLDMTKAEMEKEAEKQVEMDCLECGKPIGKFVHIYVNNNKED